MRPQSQKPLLIPLLIPPRTRLGKRSLKGCSKGLQRGKLEVTYSGTARPVLNMFRENSSCDVRFGTHIARRSSSWCNSDFAIRLSPTVGRARNEKGAAGAGDVRHWRYLFSSVSLFFSFRARQEHAIPETDHVLHVYSRRHS